MYYNRLIPCLLLDHGRLVKTKQFNNPHYIGDPMNAVKIFNDKEVDELIFLDIRATKENRRPDFAYLQKIAEHCFMPLCYGGGVSYIEDIRNLFKIGFEKVAINTNAFLNENLIKKAVELFGSQSIVGSVDVGKDIFGKKVVKIINGKKNIKRKPLDYVKWLEEAGTGEILLNSITHDGMMKGYDYELIEEISHSVKIPVIACGGAGSLEDCKEAINCGASAAAAGSIFVFWGANKAVLINYPETEEVCHLFV